MATKKVTEENVEQHDLFNLDESTASYLDNPKKNEDGLYRPRLELIKNKKSGAYESTIRFLPNLTRDNKVLPSAIEKHIHYAKFENHPELSGYYDCAKNFGEKCDLCTTYWMLYNSKDEMTKEKSKLIARSTKLYQYVLIVEDENQKELEGKILVFPYGVKIKEKIKAQKEHAKRPCRVEDLSAGRDMLLKIVEKGGFANYDSSEWDDVSTIKLQDEDGEWVTPSVGTDGKIVAKQQGKVKEFLLSREVELEDFAAKHWTEEQQTKINKIIGILTGVDDDMSIGSTPKNSKTAADVLGSMDAASEAEEQLEEASSPAPAPKKSTSSFFEDLED